MLEIVNQRLSSMRKPTPLTLESRLALQIEMVGVVNRIHALSSPSLAAGANDIELRNLEEYRDYLRRWLDLGIEPQFAKPVDRYQRFSIN